MENELYHHGILGMHWGIRRYQNPDGSLTPAGRSRLERKDAKWAKRNYNKIYSKTYKKSRAEMEQFVGRDLAYQFNGQLYTGRKLKPSVINVYNRKLAEVMNRNVGDIPAPSGRVVQFVAKRGEKGVHMALADRGYDISQLKNGVWGSGKIAYKKKHVDMA